MSTGLRALLADRFLRFPNGRTFDLASGEEVSIRITHDVSANGKWAERCAALYMRRHPHLVELLDYGALGPTSVFEAFRTRGPVRPWPGADATAAQALQSSAAFLIDQGLSPGRVDRTRVVAVAGESRVLPDETTGHELEHDAMHDSTPHVESSSAAGSHAAGILLQPRPVIDQVTEFVEQTWTGAPRWLELRAPGGSGASTVLRFVAREVRLRGFVPVSARLIHEFGFDPGGNADAWPPPEIAGRHVVLLDDRDETLAHEDRATRLAHAILELGAVVPQPRIAVVSVSDRNTGLPAVALNPLTPDQVLSMLAGRHRHHPSASLTRAARASRGWPGPFIRSAHLSDPHRRDASVARERAPRFATAAGQSSLPAKSGGADLEGWRRLVEGRALAGRGRHAAAVRTLREAAAMFQRRNDQLHAGTAWHELGELLLSRGGIKDACHAFEQAGRHFRRSGATRRALAAAASEGVARIEAGQFGTAEAILEAADLAAAPIHASAETLMVRAALVQCLHWQAKWDDAARVVEREKHVNQVGQDSSASVEQYSEAADEPAPSAARTWLDRVHWHCAAATVALRLRALDEASSHVTSAITACQESSALAKCAAHTVAIRLHGWIGDPEAVRLHAARALEAARVARASVEALRVRAHLMSALNHLGARKEAVALAMQLLRRQPRGLPPLLAAELAMVIASILPDSAPAQKRRAEAEAFARATGAAALLIGADVPYRLPKPIHDIVDVLRTTHEFEDEDALLAEVARLLRERLGAASVIFAAAHDPEAPVASAGSPRSVGISRAIEVGIVLGPLHTSAGIEIAAPIRCGGATIGGLGCRWSAAGPTQADHARTIIVAAATMSGPFLKALLDRRQAPQGGSECPELIGVSDAMADLRRAIARAAAAPFPVLIVGESGVGKELVARAIHRAGPRRLRNFAALNCAALPDDLVEAELFGHARGAFTGAIAERRGLFEEADGGTLFLDEVSELSPRAQSKLLRVLQEGEVRRVGESFARHVEIRIVAASNRPLDVTGGERPFRQDLRYRLDVLRIDVPPLRQRVEDIPVLAASFWARVAPLTGCRARLSPSTLAALARYDWPGNVRELQNVMSALVIAAPRYGVVSASALPATIARVATPRPDGTLVTARAAFERRLVAAALARAGGRSGLAARELGLTRQGLGKLIKRLGIVDQKTEDRSQKTEARTHGGIT